MQIKIKLTIWNGGKYGDDPECSCGNATHLDGYHPAQLNGELVEPDQRWTNAIHLCGRCNLLGIVVTDSVFNALSESE